MICLAYPVHPPGRPETSRLGELNDKVDRLIRNFRHEAVLWSARQIEKAAVDAAILGWSGVAGHDVRVDIDRIDRVWDGDFVLVAEYIENIPAIAFRSVRDKNLIIGEVDIRNQKLDRYWTVGQWQDGFFHAVAGVGFSDYKPVRLKTGWA